MQRPRRTLASIVQTFFLLLIATLTCAPYAWAASPDDRAIETEWVGVTGQSGPYTVVRLDVTIGDAILKSGQEEPTFWITGTIERMRFSEVVPYNGKRKSKDPPPTVLSSQPVKGHYRPLSRTFAFMHPIAWDRDPFARDRTTGIVTDNGIVFGVAGPAGKIYGVAVPAARFPELAKAISPEVKKGQYRQVDPALVQVEGHKGIDWWESWLQQRLDSLEPDATADRQLAVVYLWGPSTLIGDRNRYRAMTERTETAKRRVLIPAAERALEEIERAPHDKRIFELADAWQHRFSGNLHRLDQATYQRFVERSIKAVDGAIVTMLAAEVSPPAAGSAPFEALVAGSRQYLQLKEHYGLWAARDGFKLFFLQNRASRDEQLIRGKDELLRRISSASSSKQLESELGIWLAVPGDEENEAGRAISSAAVTAIANLQWQEKLAMYSRNEQRWLQRDGTLNLPAQSPPPDADDIQVALLREYALFGGAREKPRATRFQLPFMKLFNVWFEMSLSDVRVQRIGRMEDGSYAVDFWAKLHMNYNADAATAQAMTQGSMQVLAGLMDQVNASPPVLRAGSFRLTPEGWRSPTEQQAMVDGASAALIAASSLVDSVRRQIFGPRTVIIYP